MFMKPIKFLGYYIIVFVLNGCDFITLVMYDPTINGVRDIERNIMYTDPVQ